MKHILFFALKEDLIPVLEVVEKNYPIKYIRTGQREKPELTAFNSGIDIPNLGRASSESGITCESFLVTESNRPVRIRPITRADDTEYFCVDQLLNPDTVTFTPAGLWKDEVVLYGRVATASNSAPAQQLMKRFHSAIKKNFTRIKAYWVGPEARKLLDLGKRLTIAEQSPHEFDLSLK